MKHLHALAIAAAMLSTSAAIAQTANGSMASLNAIFDEIDLNHDGSLTKLEMSTFGAKRNIGPIVKDKAWRALDANHDGRISRKEFLQYVVAHDSARGAH